MKHRLLSLLLAALICLSLASCAMQQETPTPVRAPLEIAQELLEKGDVAAAYKLLFNLERKTKTESELLSRFVFVPTEYRLEQSVFSYTYNEDGTPATLVVHDENTQYTITYTYSEDGTTCTQVSFEQEPPFTTVYTLNAEENTIVFSYDTPSGSGTHTKVYDSTGRLLSWNIEGYDGDGSFRTRNAFYNENGLLEQEYFVSDVIGEYTHTYEYDRADKPVRRIEKYADSSSATYVYSYRESGLLSTIENARQERVVRFTYKYEDNTLIKTQQTEERGVKEPYVFTYRLMYFKDGVPLFLRTFLEEDSFAKT